MADALDQSFSKQSTRLVNNLKNTQSTLTAQARYLHELMVRHVKCHLWGNI